MRPLMDVAPELETAGVFPNTEYSLCAHAHTMLMLSTFQPVVVFY